MSVRKLATTHVLPNNPTWIEFPRSDGDTRVLPKNTQRIVDGEGCVNFMRPVPLDESTAINWRVVIGAELAKRMGLPEGPSYVLQSFPEGYNLYDHNKGPATAPRHDPYLCGSTNVNRFRSINEFIPHALWLMQDPNLVRSNCECKYCAKKPQRVITDTLELPSTRRASGTPSSTPAKGIRGLRAPRAVKNIPYAAVRRTPKPATPTGPQQRQALVPDRDTDIRAALTHNEHTVARWFRKGELVWCSLDPPILGASEADSIYFWPGLVEGVDIKSEPIPRPPEEGGDQSKAEGTDLTALYVQDMDTEPAPIAEAPEPFVPAPNDLKARAPWSIRQRNVYTIKLLAVTHQYMVSDSQVLPYLAHAPSLELLNAVSTQLVSELHARPRPDADSNLTTIFPFNPVRTEPEGPDGFAADYERIKQAAAPFTLAVQIASNLAHFWSPTDEWECTFTIPPPEAPAEPTPPEPAPISSLHALITHSMANNAADINTRSSAQAAPHIITQLRFQGLWWGAERIWTDELVRLKLARRQFAPEGIDVVFPPSGPSASTRIFVDEAGQADAVDAPELGAAEKGLFLRLEGLFVVEVPKADGVVNRECRASGSLYELADEDWEGDEEIQGMANGTRADGPHVSGKGKGKARASDVGWAQAQSSPLPRTPGRGEADSLPDASQGSTGPSFMPGPSPLKPAPLPNPDPSVPIRDTAKDTLSQMASANGKQKRRTLGAQLSHPVLGTPYPLPDPPKGFKFRRIHPPGHEIVLSLSLISGRYYPHLFAHPLMDAVVEKALHVDPQHGGLYEHRHLWAMEGLLPGVHQSMEPSAWKPSRTIMFKEADQEARARFNELWQDCKQEREHLQELGQGSMNHQVIDVDML